MSLRGQINKISGDFENAIRMASMKGKVDSEGGIHGTRKLYGYVCKVHPLDDEEKELRGTVDIREYTQDIGADEYDYEYDYDDICIHKGVMCSANNINKNGVYMMPALYSDVVFVQDPVDMCEYVLMCSHVDVIQLQSHTDIKVGVVETEECEGPSESEENSMDSLKETGNAAYTKYNKERILHTVKTKDGEITVQQTIDGVNVTAKDSVVTIAADGTVTISAHKIQVTGSETIKTSSPDTTINGNKVEVTGGQFVRKGKAILDGKGGFCGIPVCPFTGAVHIGSTIISE